MNLTQPEFDKGHEILEESLKFKTNDEFQTYLSREIDDFVDGFNMSKLNNRQKIHDFLKHLHTLYFNIELNGREIYLLSEREIDFAETGRSIIINYLNKFREQGL